MSDETIVQKEETIEAMPVPPIVATEEVKEAVEPTGDAMLPLDVTFDDLQVEAISAAGLQPAQVRNEIGLVFAKREPAQVEGSVRLTLDEAIKRASARYLKSEVTI